MQIVIDIPDEYYELYKDTNNNVSMNGFAGLYLLEIIRNGKPLPKGHGAIIDIKQIHRVEIEDSCTGRKMIWNNNPKINDTTYYLTAPTIIEADKEGEDE